MSVLIFFSGVVVAVPLLVAWWIDHTWVNDEKERQADREGNVDE